MQSRAHRHGLPKETVLTCVLFRNVVSRVCDFAREKKNQCNLWANKARNAWKTRALHGSLSSRTLVLCAPRIEQSEGGGVPAFGET